MLTRSNLLSFRADAAPSTLMTHRAPLTIHLNHLVHEYVTLRKPAAQIAALGSSNPSTTTTTSGLLKDSNFAFTKDAGCLLEHLFAHRIGESFVRVGLTQCVQKRHRFSISPYQLTISGLHVSFPVRFVFLFFFFYAESGRKQPTRPSSCCSPNVNFLFYTTQFA